MHQLALAMHNYHDTHGCFPPGAVTDGEATPGSMRHGVFPMLLPFLDETALFNAYNFTNSGADVANSTVAKSKLVQLLCPSDPDDQPRFTSSWHAGYMPNAYAVSIGSFAPMMSAGNNGMFHWCSRVRVRDIRDGTSQTTMIGHVKQGGAFSGNTCAGVYWSHLNGKLCGHVPADQRTLCVHVQLLVQLRRGPQPARGRRLLHHGRRLGPLPQREHRHQHVPGPLDPGQQRVDRRRGLLTRSQGWQADTGRRHTAEGQWAIRSAAPLRVPQAAVHSCCGPMLTRAWKTKRRPWISAKGGLKHPMAFASRLSAASIAFLFVLAGVATGSHSPDGIVLASRGQARAVIVVGEPRLPRRGARVGPLPAGVQRRCLFGLL